MKRATIGALVLGVVLAACGGADSSAPAAPAAPAPAPAPAEPAAPSFDAESYFRGKRIEVLVGFSAGGGMDSYARLLADYLPKFIPGEPTLVVVNRPGAGGAVVGGIIQDETDPDGYTIGMPANHSLAEAVGDTSVPYKPTNLEYIGDLSPDPPACIFRTDVGSTLEELQAVSATRALRMGSTGPSAGGTIWASAMGEWMGLQVNVISGYPGTQEIQLAFEQGELDGYCNGIASVFIDAASMFSAGTAVMITYHGADPLGGVFPDSVATTTVTDAMWAPNMVSDPAAQERLRELGAIGRGYHKAFVLPKDTPQEVIDVFVEAMAEMVKDPEFLAAAERANRPIQYVSRDEIIERVNRVFTMSDPIRTFLDEILNS